MLWWAQRNLIRQARSLRNHYSYNPTSNGHGKSSRQKLLIPKRKLGPYIAAAIVFFILIGAQRCRPTRELGALERTQAKIDIHVGCFINNCTPEQLRGLLSQLDTYYPQKEIDNGQDDYQD